MLLATHASWYPSGGPCGRHFSPVAVRLGLPRPTSGTRRLSHPRPAPFAMPGCVVLSFIPAWRQAQAGLHCPSTLLPLLTMQGLQSDVQAATKSLQQLQVPQEGLRTSAVEAQELSAMRDSIRNLSAAVQRIDGRLSKRQVGGSRVLGQHIISVATPNSCLKCKGARELSSGHLAVAAGSRRSWVPSGRC